MADIRLRSWLEASPPFRPAARASSDENSCAEPFSCAALPPLLPACQASGLRVAQKTGSPMRPCLVLPRRRLGAGWLPARKEGAHTFAKRRPGSVRRCRTWRLGGRRGRHRLTRLAAEAGVLLAQPLVFRPHVVDRGLPGRHPAAHRSDANAMDHAGIEHVEQE